MLISLGLIDEQNLEHAMTTRSGNEKMKNKYLGEVLAELNFISTEVLQETLKIQRATGLKRSVIENFKQYQMNEIKGLHLIKIEGDIKAGNLHIVNSNITTQPNEIFLFLEEKTNNQFLY